MLIVPGLKNDLTESQGLLDTPAAGLELEMDSPTIAGTPAPIKVSCASALVKQNQQQQQQNQHSEQLIHGKLI